MRIERISLITQSLFYLLAAINHFWHERFYVHTMPDHYAHPETLIRLSGIAEFMGGIGLLLPFTRRTASLGIATMLIVFFDVHIYMLRHAERFPEAPRWLLWARISLQFALIAWALYYFRPRTNADTRPLLNEANPSVDDRL
jgi:uncharacterized membrane protein